MAGRETFTVETIFRGIDKMSAPMSRMQNRMGLLSREAQTLGRRFDRNFTNINRGLTRGFRSALIPIALAGLAFGDIVRKGADFDKFVVSAASKLPGVARGTQGLLEANVKLFTEFSRAQAKLTEFTPIETAQGLDALVRAGFGTKEAMSALPKVTDLATVSFSDLGTTTTMAIQTMGALGLGVGTVEERMIGLGKAIDLLAFISISSQSDIPLAFETFKQAGPVARTYGQDIATVAALTANLSKNALIGSQSGRMMKRMFGSLQGVGNKSKAIFHRMDIDIANSLGGPRDAIDVFGEFFDKVDKFGGLQGPVMTGVFGQIAAPAGAALKGEIQNLRDFRERVRREMSLGGLTSALATMQRNTVGGDISRVKSAFADMQLAVFGNEKNPLRIILGRLQGSIVDLTKSIESKSPKGGFLGLMLEKEGRIKTLAVSLAALTAAWVGLGLAVKTGLGGAAIWAGFTTLMSTAVSGGAIAAGLAGVILFGLEALVVVGLIAAVATATRKAADFLTNKARMDKFRRDTIAPAGFKVNPLFGRMDKFGHEDLTQRPFVVDLNSTPFSGGINAYRGRRVGSLEPTEEQKARASVADFIGRTGQGVSAEQRSKVEIEVRFAEGMHAFIKGGGSIPGVSIKDAGDLVTEASGGY